MSSTRMFAIAKTNSRPDNAVYYNNLFRYGIVEVSDERAMYLKLCGVCTYSYYNARFDAESNMTYQGVLIAGPKQYHMFHGITLSNSCLYQDEYFNLTST